MGDVGDDFGDLYGEVEVQASSALDGALRFYDDDTEKVEGFASGSGPKELDSGDVSSSRKSEKEEPNVVDNESDSEDDLNIVLNDEGDIFPARSVVGVLGGSDGEDGDGAEQGFGAGERGNGVKGGYHFQFSKYKYVWSHSTVFSSNGKANGKAKVASFPPMMARGEWDENGNNQLKGSCSGEVASTRSMAAPLVAQGGYGFSLPWYRTILDVNIDMFEQKPWRHPGVDLSDFFNFGFDEDTWKNYCNSLEQYRKQMYTLNQTPGCRSSRPSQTAEGGHEHEKDDQELFCKQGSIVSRSSKSTDRLDLPKGRAIQVEGSTGERQPSADVRRPRHRDSDVVIHIAVQDSVDDEIDQIDIAESSRNGVEVGDDKDNCYGSDNEHKRIRSSKLLTTSNPVSVDSDNDANGKIPDNDTHGSQNMSVHVPEGMTKVVDALNTTRNQMVGKNSWNADPCMMEKELSLDEQASHGPASSCHGSHSEASKNGGYIDPEKNQNSKRETSSNLLTNQPDSITSEYYLHKNSKNKVGKMRPTDCKDSFRSRSSVREAPKNRNFYVQKFERYSDNDVASPRSKIVDSLYDSDLSPVCHRRQKERLHELVSRDDDVFPMSNSEDFFYKHCSSASHRQQENRCDLGSYDDDFSSMSEVEGQHNRAHASVGRQEQKERIYDFDSHDKDIFPMPETDGCRYKGHSVASRHRRKGQLYAFDSCNREGFSYFRETKLSFGQDSEKFADNNVQSMYTENSHRKDPRSCRDEKHLRYRNKYFSEKRITRVSDKIMERDWCHREKNLNIEDTVPLTRRESRKLGLKYSYSDKERDTRWRTKNDKLKFQKGPTNDDDFFQYENTDDFVHENFRRSFMCNETNTLAEKYERRMPSTGKNVNFCGRGKRFEESYLDSSWSVRVDDEYGRHVDHWSYRESHTANGRSDANDSRLTERNGIYRRQKCPQGYKDGNWFGNRDDAHYGRYDQIESDDPVHIGRRRSRQQYEPSHWTENEVIFGHLDENSYNDEASLPYERDSRHTMIPPKYGSAHVGMLRHNEKSEWQRYKRTKEGRRDNFINRNSNILLQGNHEQRVLRSRASVDLIVGEGKSSGKCFKSGSAKRPGRFEYMDRKNDDEQGTLKDRNGPQRVKPIQPDFKNGSNQNTKDCLDKCVVAEQNEALDVEEGQVIPEEMDKNHCIQTKHTSESIAPRVNVKRRLGTANAAKGNKVVAEYDEQQILRSLAKMEKRQERFKEPITLKKEPDNILKPQVEILNPQLVETSESIQQRPARKRRWNAN